MIASYSRNMIAFVPLRGSDGNALWGWKNRMEGVGNFSQHWLHPVLPVSEGDLALSQWKHLCSYGTVQPWVRLQGIGEAWGYLEHNNLIGQSCFPLAQCRNIHTLVVFVLYLQQSEQKALVSFYVQPNTLNLIWIMCLMIRRMNHSLLQYHTETQFSILK